MPFWLGCRAGCHVIGIESNGNVKGCLSLPSQVQGESRFVEATCARAVCARSGTARVPSPTIANSVSSNWRLLRRVPLLRHLSGRLHLDHVRRITALAAGNPHCFYHQAVKHGRGDLLDEEPTDEEKAFFG